MSSDEAPAPLLPLAGSSDDAAPLGDGSSSPVPAATSESASAPMSSADASTEMPSDVAPSETPSDDAPTADTPSDDAPSDDAPSADEGASEDDSAPALSGPAVTVSFTFDDTYGPQVEAAEILETHGLRGTFYVNSPQLHRGTARPGPAAAMSIADVLAMQARGHDIGGHTLGHLSLTDIPEAERVREILGDRAQLVALGIDARSFAYPYGHVENDDSALGRPVLEIARDSGYTSARDTNGFDLEDCDTGPEGLPPSDPFLLRSIRSVNEPPSGAALRTPADTADTLLGWIDRAAACGGGWLPLVFHRLSIDCSVGAPPQAYCFDFEELDRLAAALESGKRCPEGEGGCYQVNVETVSEAIGITELSAAPEVPGLRNASLERTLVSGATECIRRTGGSDAVFSRSELANSGLASERLELASPVLAVAEIGVERDFGECSIFASEGRAYQLSLHYRAEPGLAVPTLRFVTYRLSSDYEWLRWETGTAFAARSPGTWVRLGFTTSAVPSDTIAISFGLRQESAGAINVDDLDSVPLGSD